MAGIIDGVSLDRLIGDGEDPGVLDKLGTLGSQLGDTSAQFARLVGKVTGAATPSSAPAAPARSDGTLTPPAPSIVQKLTSNTTGLIVGAAALGLLLILYLRGD